MTILRILVPLLASCTLLFSQIAKAREPEKVLRIGYLAPRGVVPNEFREGLKDLGYIEGRNVVIEPRFAEGKSDRFPRFAKELVELRVDAIATLSTPAALAAKQATTSIPVVMLTAGDPLTRGVVRNLARPGGNITGLTGSVGPAELTGKRLELLKEIVPELSVVAVLLDARREDFPSTQERTIHAAGLLGVKVVSQQAGRVYRVGFLADFDRMRPNFEVFRQALEERGYIEGQNLVIEWRFAGRNPERLAKMAEDLVREKVDVIVTGGPLPPAAALNATRTIPIVNPLNADTYVADLGHPGGNLTGLTTMATDYAGKRLQLFKEAVPKLSRVAVLVHMDHPGATRMLQQAGEVATPLGLSLVPIIYPCSGRQSSIWSSISRQRGSWASRSLRPFYIGRTK